MKRECVLFLTQQEKKNYYEETLWCPSLLSTVFVELRELGLTEILADIYSQVYVLLYVLSLTCDMTTYQTSALPYCYPLLIAVLFYWMSTNIFLKLDGILIRLQYKYSECRAHYYLNTGTNVSRCFETSFNHTVDSRIWLNSSSLALS